MDKENGEKREGWQEDPTQQLQTGKKVDRHWQQQ
jgi:hypothetical protein